MGYIRKNLRKAPSGAVAWVPRAGKGQWADPAGSGPEAGGGPQWRIAGVASCAPPAVVPLRPPWPPHRVLAGFALKGAYS